MTKAEIANDYFKNNFNCSQSVLSAFAPELGISDDTSMKIASAFGAGIARRQLTCGAVTGAVMAISLKFGKGINDEDSKKVFTYEKSIALMNEFTQKHGSVCCRELLNGLDMVKDAEKIKELNLFRTRCVTYVSDAVEITEELLK
jgi:C_GCAxxG_C_C family probable redox protein